MGIRRRKSTWMTSPISIFSVHRKGKTYWTMNAIQQFIFIDRVFLQDIRLEGTVRSKQQG